MKIRFSGFFILAFIILIVCDFYNGHRYILQVNDSGTSPTYRDTPPIISYSKYIILLVLGVVLFSIGNNRIFKCFIPRNPIGLASFLCAVTALVLGVFSCLLNAAGEGISQLLPAVTLFFGFLFCILLSPTFSDYSSLRSLIIPFLTISIMYHLIYVSIQIILFYAMGRLPALGYEGGIVRYGGGWDDPNGYPTYGITLVCAAILFAEKRRLLGTAAVLLCAASVILAASYSGWIGFATGLGVFLILTRKWKMCAFLVVLTIGIIALPVTQNWLADTVEAKYQSMASRMDHALFSAMLNNSSVRDLLFGFAGLPGTSENSILRAVILMGLPTVIFYYLAFGLAVLQGCIGCMTLQRMKSPARASGLAIAVAFLVSFIVASNGFPALMVFPVNVFAWCAMGIIWYEGMVGLGSAVLPHKRVLAFGRLKKRAVIPSETLQGSI